MVHSATLGHLFVLRERMARAANNKEFRVGRNANFQRIDSGPRLTITHIDDGDTQHFFRRIDVTLEWEDDGTHKTHLKSPRTSKLAGGSTIRRLRLKLYSLE